MFHRYNLRIWHYIWLKTGLKPTLPLRAAFPLMSLCPPYQWQGTNPAFFPFSLLVIRSAFMPRGAPPHFSGKVLLPFVKFSVMKKAAVFNHFCRQTRVRLLATLRYLIPRQPLVNSGYPNLSSHRSLFAIAKVKQVIVASNEYGETG